MNKLDIRFWKLILVGGGLIIVVSVLCLLADEYLTGMGGWLPAWGRVLVLVGGLAIIVVALAVKRRR